jgi:hypothetical protein
MHDFPERDGKVLRQIMPLALDRYCERTLEDVERVLADKRVGAHARYREVYRVLGERDEDLSRAFDDMRRSMALEQILSIRGLGLFRPDEFALFSEETRARIEHVEEALRPLRRGRKRVVETAGELPADDDRAGVPSQPTRAPVPRVWVHGPWPKHDRPPV